MFEGLVHQLLVGYLGNYVKDIHKDQFRIGLWKGEVLLENVELVLEAFEYLQLPFAIKKGLIGKLSIKIPWKKLGWDPILIALEDVYICTCQRDDSEWSVGAVEARELAGKKANLAAAELAKLSRRVSDNQAGQSFISYLSAKIIDNIQVTIQNVHIRYVDQKPDSRAIFSFGLRFSTLMITTSDVNSAGGRLKGAQVNKLLQIHDMGLYWNSRERDSNEVATEDIDGVQSFCDPTLDDGQFNYILRPLSATLSLMVSKSGRFESGSPQYAVDLDLNELVLTLDAIQIYQMLMLWDYVSICRLREKYGRFRPWTRSILDRTAVGWQRMWWKYAIDAVLADVRRKLRRTSWIYFGSRMDARRKYIRLYRLKLERLQQDQHLDDASVHELEEMEKVLEMDEILNYRSLAECQLQLVDPSPVAIGHDSELDKKDILLEKQHNGEQTSNKPRGWLNWLSLGMLGAGGTTDSSQFAGVISDEVIKDIYEATKYHPASSLESGVVSKGHCYLLSIAINARQVIVTLNSMSKKVAIICMTIHGANANSNFWQDSASVSIILNSLEVVNPLINYLPFSCVLKNKDNVGSDGFTLTEAPSSNSYTQFVIIEIEMLPQSSNFDFSVRVMVQPFEFFYDVYLLENLSEFLDVLASFQSHLDLVLTSLNGFENVGARVLSKAEYIFSNRKRVSFEANFQNTVFIFPWCSAQHNWARMAFSMKSMHFVSVVGEVVPTQKFKIGQFYSSSKNVLYNTKTVQEDDLSMLKDFYDRFELKLSGVQGKLEIPNILSNIPFIQAFDAMITIDKCILQDELAMNQLMVHGDLPSIHILLSSSVCNALKDFSTNHRLKPDVFKREQVTVISELNNVFHHCKVPEWSAFGGTGVDNLCNNQLGIVLNSKNSTADMLNVVRYKVMAELKSLSIELCPDDGDKTCQEQLMLHAQIENINVESVQGAYRRKLGIGIETINIEVPNLVGSPAYSILGTKKILPTGSCNIRAENNFASKRVNSLYDKEFESGLESKFLCFLCQHIWQTGRVTPIIKVYLNNLEYHCHPKVIGTLHRFFCDVISQESVSSGVRTVDNTPVMEAETAQQSVSSIKYPKFDISGIRLDDFSKNLGISSDQFPFVCFKNEELSKSPDNSCTIDSASDEKDESVFDKAVKTGDTEAYTKLSQDNEPRNLGTATAMDINAVINESDASDNYKFEVDLEVNSTDIHFHDSACLLATVVIPKSKSFVFLSKNNALWDVMVSFEGVRILSLWDPATNGEVLWGPLVHGPCPVVNLRFMKREQINGYSELEMGVSIQHTCCVLPSDFLAIVVGYFASSHWEQYFQTESDLSKRKDNLTSESTSSHFHCKVEVIDSVLILPVEKSCNEFLELGLPQLFFTLFPNCTTPYMNGNMQNGSISAVYLSGSKMDFIDIAGKQLSLSFASTKNDEQKMYGKDPCPANAKLPLIERLDADLSLRIPCDVEGSSHSPFVPTSIVFNAQRFEANVLEKSFLSGVQAIEDVVLKLSTVSTTSQLFVSSVSQFMESVVEFKYSNTGKSEVPTAYSIDVKFFMSNVLLKLLHTSREEAMGVLKLIGKVDAQQLNVSGFWGNESLEALALEILSLNVFSCSNSVTLLKCISKESSHPGVDVHICTLDTGVSEASISVPCIDICLHSSAWSELFDFSVTCIQSPSRTECVSLGSSQTGFTDAGDFNDVVEPCSKKLDGPGIRPGPFCLKSGTLNIYIHVPDFSSEEKVGVSDKEPVNRQGLYWHGSSVKLDDGEKYFMGSESLFYKFISFSLSVCLDELVLLDGKWTFKARIVQIKGKTQNFREQCVHCLPFCHVADIELEGKIWDENAELRKMILSIQMDTMDLWCSYPILCFWHSFNFGRSKNASSTMASDLSLDVCVSVRKASFLLSDGRWSCNAPIMETFIRHICFRANWRNGTLESSISLEAQMNYHNIHKVTWEPFLEPWSVQCHLTRNFGCNGLLSTSPTTDIYIDSLSQLNLNLTETLMQAAVRGNEMIKDMWDGIRSDDCPGNYQTEEYSPLGNAHVRRYAPYFLQNDTGVPLNFWLIRGPTIAESNEILDRAVRSSVEPGCAVPLFVEETPEELFQRRRPNQSSERLVDRKTSGSRHHMICIQLEGTSRASIPMSMDLVGLRSLEVDFSKTFRTRQRHQEQDPPAGIGIQETIKKAYSNSKFVVPVIFEVSTQRYSKLVRLYSTVTLVNATCVSLEVRFDIPFGIAPKVMDPILPGQELPLPVHLAETGRIRYRPLGSSYLWSEAQSLTNILSQDNRHGLLRSFVCYPSHPSDGPFRCCISVQENRVPCYYGMKRYSFDLQDENSRNTMNDNVITGNSVSLAETKVSFIRQITLTAPLVLKNCLPVALEFSIENGAGVTVNAFASEGDAVSVFEIDSAHELGIVFHIVGFTPSFVKFPRSALHDTEPGKVNSDVEKILITESLILNPDSSKGCPVAIKIEKALDAFCGSRELCLSVPFWLYNCSGLTLEGMDGDMDEKADERVVYSSYSDTMEQFMNAKSGMAIACDDLPSNVQVDNDVPHRGGIYWANRDMPCKIWNHLPCHKIISNWAHGSTSGSSGYFEDTSLGISGFSSHNGNHRWQRKEGNTSFSNIKDGKIEVSGKGVDQIPKFHTCMHSPAKGLQTSEATLRLRISQSKYVEVTTERSPWSHPFSLNPPNGSTTVLIPQPFSTGAVIISAIRTPVLGACAGRTTAITFQPRYVISNACSRDLFYRQRGTDSFHRLRVGEHLNLHWTDVKREFLISIRFNEPGWDWSGSFHPDQLGDTLVKLRNYVTGALQMVCIEVQNASAAVGDAKSVDNSDGSLGTYLILLSDDDTGFMPYRIDNFSMERLRFYQQKCEKFENIVQPYTSCSYAWDEPCYPHRLVIEVPGEGLVGAYTLDDVRDYTPVHLTATPEKSERRFSISVHAEGPIKVLGITSEKMHIRKPSNAEGLHKFGERNTATGQIKENCMDLSEKITVCFPFIGLSIVDSVPQELAFACARGIKIQILQGLHQQKLLLQVASVQFDNQLPHPIYPVMVSNENACSGPISFQGKAKDNKLERVADVICEASPDIAFFLSAVKWRHMATSVICFESITVRVAPLRLEFEEQMILRLVDFVKSITWRFWRGSTEAQNSDMWPLKYDIDRVNNSSTDARNFKFVKNSHSSQLHFVKVMKIMESYKSEPSPAAVMPIAAPWQKLFLLARRRRKIYVEIFHIAPIKLTISFSSTPWLPKDGRKAGKQSLMWISSTTLQRGLMALMDVEGAPIHLRQLTLAHPLASWDAIQGIVIRHYTRQLLHEVYKVLGSVGVFGNPMGFARSLGFGIKDFVSVPAKSIVQNPGGIVTGMAQGTKSLLNNTVFAVSNAAAQFSKAARKGVVAFAFDEEFVAEIERRQQGQGSYNQGVLNDFLEGLTGLLQSPIRGVEKHGLPGILSGIAVGAAGLIARPVAGILEVSGRTAQSIRNRSNPRQLNHFRVRLPRPLVRDSPLVVYSWEEAVGTAVLQEVESKRLKDEVLVTCIALGLPGMFIVLTERLLLKVKSASIAAAASPENTMPGGPDWSIQLEIALDNIMHVDREGQLLNVFAANPEIYFRRPKDPRTSKQNYMSQFVPFTQESIGLPHEDAAKELSQLLGSLIDELKKRSSPSILRRENLKSIR